MAVMFAVGTADTTLVVLAARGLRALTELEELPLDAVVLSGWLSVLWFAWQTDRRSPLRATALSGGPAKAARRHNRLVVTAFMGPVLAADMGLVVLGALNAPEPLDASMWVIVVAFLAAGLAPLWIIWEGVRWRHSRLVDVLLGTAAMLGGLLGGGILYVMVAINGQQLP